MMRMMSPSRPAPEPKFTEMEFLAYILYQESEGRDAVYVRWWCMSEVLKDAYLKRANELFAEWVGDETRARTNAMEGLEIG